MQHEHNETEHHYGGYGGVEHLHIELITLGHNMPMVCAAPHKARVSHTMQYSTMNAQTGIYRAMVVYASRLTNSTPTTAISIAITSTTAIKNMKAKRQRGALHRWLVFLLPDSSNGVL